MKTELKSLGEVRFKVAKNAFEGPFVCCNRKTKKISKKISYKGLDFSYEAWSCSKCRKEYLDPSQAKNLERFWTVQKMLDDNLLTMQRALNFDGKTFFFRFPKELTKNWSKHSHVEIKLLDSNEFLVGVKS